MIKASEQDIITALRERAENQKPKVIETKKGISKEEALSEAEYMLRKTLKEKRPTSPAQAQMIINETMQAIFTYFKEAGVDISKEELINYFSKEK